MTTREEWLRKIDQEMRADNRLSWGRVYSAPYNPILPSFPARSTRTVLLGDLAQQEDGTTVLLVSPLISSSLEIALVLHWLRVRQRNYFHDARKLTTRHAADVMGMAGYVAPFKSCVPSEALIDRIDYVVNRVVDRIGEYPSEDVRLVTRATQTTRLLKVACTNHFDDYILRMSQKQYDRGAPRCGVCSALMSLV
jgi:hypothetical protein